MPASTRIVALVLGTATIIAQASPVATSAAGLARPYIVVMRPGAAAHERGTTAARLRARQVTRTLGRSVPGLVVRHRFESAIGGFAARLTATQVERLAGDPAVARIVPDATISISAVKAGRASPTAVQSAGVSDSQSVPVGIRRVGGAAWSDSNDVDVAILDTGIGTSADPGMGGELNVVGGRNCSGDGRPTDDVADGHGHGTHVAGTVGARDDSQGVVGVAPGVRLWALRVLDSGGSGTVSGLICAIDWTAAWADDHPGRRMVANLSLGGTDPYRAPTSCGSGGTSTDPGHAAICAAVSRGVVFVVAAGNDSHDADLDIPARYAEVITVSALADYDGLPGGLGSRGSCAWTTADDAFAGFSNYGAAVDLVAPGVCIRSTSRTTVGATVSMSGTSMATPHVTGGAARYLAHHASASPSQVRAGLISEASNDWTTNSDPDPVHEPLLAVTVSEPTPEPTPTPSPTPDPTPTATPEPEPTATPEPEPTATPEPEPTPGSGLQPPDDTAPTMTRLTIDDPTSVGSRDSATWTATVSWMAADDVGVVTYRVEIREGIGDWTQAYVGRATERKLSLPTGRLEVRIRATDAAGNDSGWRVLGRTAVVSDMTAALTRSRTSAWAADRSRGSAWAGTRYVTRAIGQRVTFRTDSRTSAIVAQRSPSAGRIAILVDGHRVATVDLASTSTRDRRVVWSATWATRATRTIEIRTLESPGSDTVWLDAVLALR